MSISDCQQRSNVQPAQRQQEPAHPQRPGGGFRVLARLPALTAIRVALADDQELVRSGFAALLDAEDDICVPAWRATASARSRSPASSTPT